MPELKLVLGPAGSGKTWHVVREVAHCAAQGALPGPGHPPLLVIVPEQQAAAMELEILRRLDSDHGCPATARVRVMSLTRLAAWLLQEAGAQQEQPGELGRRLLVWSLLPDSPRREAEAAVYAPMLAELAQYGVTGDDLRGRAAAHPALAEKLHQLAALQERYTAACRERGLSFAPAAACIPELLTGEHWPHLEHTLVWVDGFAGFTPVEERALRALLARCTRVTATLLLDPAVVEADAPHPLARDYRPACELYHRWLELAASTGASISEPLRLQELPRWAAGSPLADVARHGLYAAPGSAMPHAAATVAQAEALPGLRATACADERAEVEAAARTIRTLVLPPALGGRGWRYRDISMITRSLAPYAETVPLVFSEYGIPFFLDQRRKLAHHPLAEYVRCGVRLALGLAAVEDIYTLLKTDLLPGGTAWRGQVDELELYARQSALRPEDWLRPEAWRWHRELLRHEERDVAPGSRRVELEHKLAQYDAWRRALLTPVARLARELRARPAQLVLRDALAAIVQQLITDEVARILEAWAVAAEEQTPPRPDLAAQHRGVLAQLLQLFEELERTGGALQLSGGELCAWLEFGLGELDAGFSPPTLDAVLVTDIARGRQQALRGVLLLGLSEDQWPPPAEQTPFLSDAERRVLNQPDKLVAGGAEERAGRELYLALVAATRASELLHLFRPAGDMEGRQRQPSPYYVQLCRRLSLSEGWAGADGSASAPPTLGELYRQAGLAGPRGPLEQAAQELRPVAQGPAAALDWGRMQAQARGLLPALSPAELNAALGAGLGQVVLHGSVSRLETFAACPFKHFTHYLLRIGEPPERDLTLAGLGGFYHRVLERTISALNAQDCDWAALTPDEFVAAGLAALEAAGPALQDETGTQRADYVIERAGKLLAHKLPAELQRLQAAGRAPCLTELRFGHAGDPLPPVMLRLRGGELRLSGYIDRLDLNAAGQASVVDYKLSSRDVDWPQFLAGRQLQLLTYLLAVDGQTLPRQSSVGALQAVRADYSPVEPVWSGRDSGFTVHSVPPELKRQSSQEQLAGLVPQAMAQARRILRELGERILAGEITPRPLSDAAGRWTACSECSYRALCRFDPLAGGRYREMRSESSSVLRDRIAGGEDFAGSAGGGPEPEVRR